MEKQFDTWNELKKSVDKREGLPSFKERDIWWCSIGLNVGHEENGKNAAFHRPVLVVRKFNNRLFWGVPLTSQIKDNKHYHNFTFLGRPQCAMLTQLRLFDVSRFGEKMGRLAEKEFKAIRADLVDYLK